MARILIVDDEPKMRRILASHLRQDKHEVMEASGVEEARRSLAANDFDVVFTDQRMPDGEGLEVLQTAKESNPTISVVFLTAMRRLNLPSRVCGKALLTFLQSHFSRAWYALPHRVRPHTQVC